jgi:hypothetical protein
MMEENEGSSHHVAWKDRLGLNQQWMRDIQACSASHGTDDYVNQVDRFRNDVVNIKKGPNLYDDIAKEWDNNISKYGNNLFIEWAKSHPQEAKIAEECDAAQERIRLFQAEKLYHFIIQTLENNGFGFYQSTVEEDHML